MCDERVESAMMTTMKRSAAALRPAGRSAGQPAAADVASHRGRRRERACRPPAGRSARAPPTPAAAIRVVETLNRPSTLVFVAVALRRQLTRFTRISTRRGWPSFVAVAPVQRPLASTRLSPRAEPSRDRPQRFDRHHHATQFLLATSRRRPTDSLHRPPRRQPKTTTTVARRKKVRFANGSLRMIDVPLFACKRPLFASKRRGEDNLKALDKLLMS